MNRMKDKIENIQEDVGPNIESLHSDITEMVKQIQIGFAPMEEKVNAVVHLIDRRLEQLRLDVEAQKDKVVLPTSSGRNVKRR